MPKGLGSQRRNELARLRRSPAYGQGALIDMAADVAIETGRPAARNPNSALARGLGRESLEVSFADIDALYTQELIRSGAWADEPE